MAETAAALDLSCFAYLSVPHRPRATPRLISNYPPVWTTHYLQHHYERFDPVIIQALGHPEPFKWGLGAGSFASSEAQRELFEEAARFGIRCGFTIPIHDNRNPVAAVLSPPTSDSRSSNGASRSTGAYFSLWRCISMRMADMTDLLFVRPTLRSERAEGQKNTFLVRWQFGLAGIAAEAEDPNWAKRLTESEAELACRYAPLEFNSFPSWLETVAVEYPQAVDGVLGQELSLSLREVASTNGYSMFLQNISHAPAIVAALFVPRIRAWLAEVAQSETRPNDPQYEQNLRQAIEILVKSGTDDDRRFIEVAAQQRLAGGLTVPFAKLWLP